MRYAVSARRAMPQGPLDLRIVAASLGVYYASTVGIRLRGFAGLLGSMYKRGHWTAGTPPHAETAPPVMGKNVDTLSIDCAASAPGHSMWRTTGQRARATLFLLFAIALPVSADSRQPVRSSLLLLIDTSGSMSSEIGNGNPEIKIEAAKEAALGAANRALANNVTEVAVIGFSGDCSNPISEHLDFTTNANQLARFIRGLEPRGGTPMAEALLVANRVMEHRGTPGTHSQMIVLLADGDNDCGDVVQAMDQLRAAGIAFRHETVGFGIEPTSAAARDLRHVANASGGQYHHATTATQLADVFMEFVDTITVIDMLGMFGSGNASRNSPRGLTTTANSSSSVGPSVHAGTSVDDDQGSFTSMIGMFKVEDPKETAGALAIDSAQGEAWGWAAGHATVAQAEREALAECGEECRIVVRFEEGCAAYAADQDPGSTVFGWASELDSGVEATEAALDDCAKRGGADCLVRVWACGNGTGDGAAGRASAGGLARHGGRGRGTERDCGCAGD